MLPKTCNPTPNSSLSIINNLMWNARQRSGIDAFRPPRSNLFGFEVMLASDDQFFTGPVLVPRRHRQHSDVRFSMARTTYHPSGRYRLTTSGIFFSLSSLIAMASGSVISPTSTKTGAFILPLTSAFPPGIFDTVQPIRTIPDLQSPRS